MTAEIVSLRNLLLYGGPILFLGAQTWHTATLFEGPRRSRVVALVIAGTVTLIAPAYLAAIVAAAIVVTVAAFEDRSRTEARQAQPRTSPPA